MLRFLENVALGVFINSLYALLNGNSTKINLFIAIISVWAMLVVSAYKGGKND